LAQTQWNKHVNNPVLVPGNPGSWDETTAVATTVFFHEGIYKMWYEGDGGFGYATSSDGLVWAKDSLYHMWYTGWDNNDNLRVGYATSPDGFTWTKDSANPVLGPGNAGEWDALMVAVPVVRFRDNQFNLWYGGFDGTWFQSGYATSNDTATTSITNPSDDDLLPSEYELRQNYPNPFNPATTIVFALPHASQMWQAHITLNVYDMVGRKVRTLVNERKTAGTYTVQWDGTNDIGQPVASGVYLYRIQAGNFSAARKMLLLH